MSDNLFLEEERFGRRLVFCGAKWGCSDAPPTPVPCLLVLQGCAGLEAPRKQYFASWRWWEMGTLTDESYKSDLPPLVPDALHTSGSTVYSR